MSGKNLLLSAKRGDVPNKAIEKLTIEPNLENRICLASPMSCVMGGLMSGGFMVGRSAW